MATSELQETELRILAELEEYGIEDVPTLMNTVGDPKGDAAEIGEMQRALRTLLELGLVNMQMSSLPGGDVPLASEQAKSEIDDLLIHLKFKSDESYWIDERMKGPPFFQIPVPEVVRTPAGLEAGIRALDERGYQWWRSKEG